MDTGPSARVGRNAMTWSRRVRLLLVALVTLLAASQPALPAGAFAPGGTDSTGAKIATYLKVLAAKNQLSGAVMVVRKGRVLLARGYGMADLKDSVANKPGTKYPLIGGFTTTATITAVLRLEQHGKINDQDSICSHLKTCPAKWKPITIHMLLDGTSGLPGYEWGRQGVTTAQSLAACRAGMMSTTPGIRVSYEACAVLVLGTIIEQVTGTSWASAMRQLILGPAGMTQSGRITDSLLPPQRARGYSGNRPDGSNVYNDMFGFYATVGDVYAYDNALFTGKLLSRPLLRKMLTPRDIVDPADPGISGGRWGYRWKIGRAVGRQVNYLTGESKSFTYADLRFSEGGVTIIVISNDAHNDVEAVAVHVAALLFGTKVASPSLVNVPAVNPAKRSS